MLSVLLSRDSDHSFGIFLSLCCLFFFDLGILITPLVSFCHCVVCSSLLADLWYLFVIVDLFFFDLGILITLVSFCHCVVCSSLIGILITPLVSFCHCVVCSSLI